MVKRDLNSTFQDSKKEEDVKHLPTDIKNLNEITTKEK